MSTFPQNASDVAKADRPAAVVPHAMSCELEAVVRHFIATADSVCARRPALDELIKMVCQAATVTHELFPEKFAVETRVDPEIRDDVCLLFQVHAEGDIEEILALRDQWHRRLLSFVPKWPGLFRLSIDVR